MSETDQLRDAAARPVPTPSSAQDGATAGMPAALVWVRNRWPTWVAVGGAALGWGGIESDDVLKGLAEFIFLLQLNYLVAAAVHRRWAAWVGLPVAIAIATVLRAQESIDPSTVLITLSAAVLLWGAARGLLAPPEAFVVQAVGMVAFAAIALVALAVDPELARYLVAAGWFAHGVWDFAHLRADKVVSRSFAEWCGVVDVLLAVQLVLVV